MYCSVLEGFKMGKGREGLALTIFEWLIFPPSFFPSPFPNIRTPRDLTRYKINTISFLVVLLSSLVNTNFQQRFKSWDCWLMVIDCFLRSYLYTHRDSCAFRCMMEYVKVWSCPRNIETMLYKDWTYKSDDGCCSLRREYSRGILK